MPTAAAVVACALALLGKSERNMPRIELVDTVPIEASVQAEAFVRPSDNTIYLVTSSPVFRAAPRVQIGLRRLHRAEESWPASSPTRSGTSVTAPTSAAHIRHSSPRCSGSASPLTTRSTRVSCDRCWRWSRSATRSPRWSWHGSLDTRRRRCVLPRRSPVDCDESPVDACSPVMLPMTELAR